MFWKKERIPLQTTTVIIYVGAKESEYHKAQSSLLEESDPNAIIADTIKDAVQQLKTIQNKGSLIVEIRGGMPDQCVPEMAIQAALNRKVDKVLINSSKVSGKTPKFYPGPKEIIEEALKTNDHYSKRKIREKISII